MANDCIGKRVVLASVLPIPAIFSVQIEYNDVGLGHHRYVVFCTSEATVHDLPDPVCPKMAECRPNRFVGSR